MNSIRNLPATLASLAAAAVSLAILFAPSPAAAATACEYDGALDLLSITTNGRNDHVQIDVSGNGSDILVREQGPIVTCAGGQATLTTTDNITIQDNGDNPDTATPNDGDTSVSLPEATALTPGATAEAGDDEIELLVLFNTGNSDRLQIFGSPGADLIRLGDEGVNWAVGPSGLEERELLYSEPDEIFVDGGAGADAISAQGGEGTDDPVDGSFLELSGSDEGDQLSGGDAVEPGSGDLIRGGDGADTVNGFAGDDVLVPGFGDDTIGGGVGADELSFNEPLQTTGVTLDLALTTPQATGQGTDTVAGVENASGTPFDDQFAGGDGPNWLRGLSGSDRLEGRGGPDQLDGGGGAADDVTYAGSPAGVTVDLTAGTASGGAGADTLTDLENITGSPFADNLTGDAMANSITALAGADQVKALAGVDAVSVRDGDPDTASCGTEVDSAEADRRSVDSVDADCENADFLPEQEAGDGGGGEGGGGEPTDAQLDFRLKGKKRQDIVDRRAAVVKAICPLEPCSVTATAKGRSGMRLKPASMELAAGARAKLELRLNKRQRSLLANAARPPKLRISATAEDAAGNRLTRTRTVRAID
jgi:Ca2+-binding RTX toxin-like protein